MAETPNNTTGYTRGTANQLAALGGLKRPFELLPDLQPDLGKPRRTIVTSISPLRRARLLSPDKNRGPLLSGSPERRRQIQQLENSAKLSPTKLNLTKSSLETIDLGKGKQYPLVVNVDDIAQHSSSYQIPATSSSIESNDIQNLILRRLEAIEAKQEQLMEKMDYIAKRLS